MKHLFSLIVIFVLLFCASYGGPIDNKDVNKDSKSAFGPAFDEIVVESQLTVRRKSNGRQARTQNVTNEGPTGIIKTKRSINLLEGGQIGHRHRDAQMRPPNLVAPPPRRFGGSAASAQAQAFNSVGPLGSFGASASGAQTQSFGVGPGGLAGGAAFSGTQQYNFNGKTIDVSFGSAFAGGQPVLTVTGPDGKKRPLAG